MEVIPVIVFLAAVTAANTLNPCPKIQKVDWEIEKLLPHRECNKFYQCTHGEPVEMSCPEGLFYSIVERRCEWRDRVICENRIIPGEPKPEDEEKEKEPVTTPESVNIENDTTTEEIVQTETTDSPIIEFLPNGCPVDPVIHWLLPHERFCNLLYYCVQGEKVLRRCPYWLHFNQELQVCDWPWKADCEELRD